MTGTGFETTVTKSDGTRVEVDLDSSYNVIGELNSSFLEKRVLFDVKLGWHHQIDEGVPADGSGFGTDAKDGRLAATPLYITHPSILRNVATLDQVPASVRRMLPS